MAHKMVIHVGHYKKGSVGALEHHNLRENESYSNKDIDRSRTEENVTLHQPERSQYLDAKQIIEQRAVNQVRSTSIWQSEFIISSDKEFFQSLPKEEQNRFFKESYEYLCSEFGRENVTCATVHYDEMTPHMHFDFVPMTEDNKLSRKEVMTRERLIRIQDQMPRYLREKGFDVERGQKMADLEQKDRPKHIEPKEYKRTLNEQMRALEGQKKQVDDSRKKLKEQSGRIQSVKKELNQQAAELNKALQEVKELPKAEKNITGKMQLPEAEYKKLYAAAQFGLVSRQQQADLRQNHKELKAAYRELQEENRELKGKLPTVRERLHQKEQLARTERLERENVFMRSAFQELQKLKLPECAAEIVRGVWETLSKTIQRQDREI